MESEIRKHYFLDKYVIIAPKRAKRPHSAKRQEQAVYNALLKDKHKVEQCFFCPGMIEKKLEVCQVPKNSKLNWNVKVINNKFPALTLNNKKAYGKQEIVIDTPNHEKEIHELTTKNIVKVIDIYISRFNDLSDLEGIKYVLVFKNEGGKAGASVPHSHSQIIALPIVPPMIEEEIIVANRYSIEHDSCPYCDIIKEEKNSKRVAWEDKNFFVLCPFASESPYGAWFIPKRHVTSICEMNKGEKESLAKALKKILKKIDDLDLSYNYFFHNTVNNEDHHMVLKLAPRPNIWAGLELGTGIIINPTTPEYAAKFYRS